MLKTYDLPSSYQIIKHRYLSWIVFVIWGRSLLLLLFWGKAVQVMRRCVYYIIYYIFGIGKNWFDIETIQRMYIRTWCKARILFSSFTVIYKNMYHGMNEVLAIYFLFIPIIPFVCCRSRLQRGSGVLICVYLFF